MDSKTFSDRVKRLHPLQACFVTFGESGHAGACRLLALLDTKTIYLAQGEDLALRAVVSSGSWGGPRNRTYTVYGLWGVDRQPLAELSKDVEKVEVGDSLVKGLTSSRHKRREEAFEEIKAGIFDKEFRKWLNEWAIDWNVTEIDYAAGPEIGVHASYDGQPVVRIDIDGWSGRISVDGVQTDHLALNVQQIRALLRAKIVAAFEGETAPA